MFRKARMVRFLDDYLPGIPHRCNIKGHNWSRFAEDAQFFKATLPKREHTPTPPKFHPDLHFELFSERFYSDKPL
jgi:hypothetical protein